MGAVGRGASRLWCSPCRWRKFRLTCGQERGRDGSWTSKYGRRCGWSGGSPRRCAAAVTMRRRLCPAPEISLARPRLSVTFAGMEGILPPMTQHGSGYERASVRQFTIFLENRVGKMVFLLRKFEEVGLRINAFSVEESTDISLLRLIASDPDLARHCLRENVFSFSETDILAVEIPRTTSMPLISVAQAL